MQKLTIILVALGALSLGACGEDDVGSDTESPSDGGVAGGDAGCSDLSYDTFGKAFFDSYCVSCHGPTLAQQHVRLDSLSGFTSSKKKALSEVSSNGMPPRGATAPSSAERAMFREWVQCGGT